MAKGLLWYENEWVILSALSTFQESFLRRTSNVLSSFSDRIGEFTFASLLFVFVLRRTGIWGNFYFFLLSVLLGSWAGGLWLPPVGPWVAGVPWGSFFLAGLILSALFSLMSLPQDPNPSGGSEGDRDSHPEGQIDPHLFLGFFGGFLILAFSFLILAGYFLAWLFYPFPL